MKKILLCFMLVLALLLTACGSAGNAPQGSGSAETEPAGAKTETTLQLGLIDGATYTNESLGYGCMLEGWVYATRDQIAELNNITLEAADKDLRKQLENADTYMDMYAQREDNLLNINVNFENLSSVYGEDLTEQQYLELSFPQMKGAMEQMGMSNVQVEKTTVVIDGTEYPGLTVTGELDGLQIFQRQACVKCGSYMGIITATSYGEDLSAEPFALFFKL